MYSTKQLSPRKPSSDDHALLLHQKHSNLLRGVLLPLETCEVDPDRDVPADAGHSGRLRALRRFEPKVLGAALPGAVPGAVLLRVFGDPRGASGGLDSDVFMMTYFLGLSVSVSGLVFEIVDKRKKQWIPKGAWP